LERRVFNAVEAEEREMRKGNPPNTGYSQFPFKDIPPLAHLSRSGFLELEGEDGHVPIIGP
jgi:hypothetical protein